MIPISILPRQRSRTVSKVPVFSSYTLLSSKSIIEEYDVGNDWHGRPTMVERNGVWIMAFVEGTAHVATSGSHQLEIVFSSDKGVTWTSKNTYLDSASVTGFQRQGNGSTANQTSDVLLIKCPNDDIIAIALDRQFQAFINMVQSRSTDGGKTWSSWTEINTQIENDPSNTWSFYDYQIVGTEIYIVGSITTNYPTSLNTAAKSFIYKSTDNGVNWTKVADINSLSDTSWEAGIVRRPDGAWLSIIRVADKELTDAEKWYSADGVNNWIQLNDIGVGGAIHQARMRYFDREDRLYCFGRYQEPGGDRENCFVYSDDLGVSWDLFVPVDFGASDGGYADCLKRSDNIFYMVGYTGDYISETASLKEFVITGNV